MSNKDSMLSKLKCQPYWRPVNNVPPNLASFLLFGFCTSYFICISENVLQAFVVVEVVVASVSCFFLSFTSSFEFVDGQFYFVRLFVCLCVCMF